MARTIGPLVVIVGETASGKSDLAIQLGQKFNGEIICADSRTIYKGMDIGTAKPTKADQTLVPHHLLDIVEPGQAYSAAQFKQDVLKLINCITKAGKLPIIVGGSGLYIDSVIFDYEFGALNATKRTQLQELSLEELQKHARKLGFTETKVDFKNRRHLARAVETGKVLKKEQQLRPNTLVIGLQLRRDVLKERITGRIEAMLARGLVKEVQNLGKKYSWDNEAMSGIGYRFFGQYIRGELSMEEAKSKFIQGDLNLAKRQRTWFKRNKYIHWVHSSTEVFSLVKHFLDNSEQ